MIDVDHEISRGRVSRESFKRLELAEGNGQASLMAWLEERLNRVKATVASGRAVKIETPGGVVTIDSLTRLHAWCDEVLPDAYACFFRAEGGTFPHTRLFPPPPRTWRQEYVEEEAYLRRAASEDPLARRETGRHAGSAEIESMFARGVRATLAGGDQALANAFFVQIMRFGARLRLEPASDGGGNPLLALYEARNLRYECIARLFVTARWDRELFDTGLRKATVWCFGEIATRWDDMVVKPHVLGAIRMALVSGDRDLFARLWNRLKGLTPLHEMPLWRQVEREPDRERQARLIRAYIAECPKGNNGSMEGNAVYQLELALVCLCVAGLPHVRITAPLLAKTVLAERGSDGR